MVAIPAPLIVQGDDEQVGGFEMLQDGLGICGLLGWKIGECILSQCTLFPTLRVEPQGEV